MGYSHRCWIASAAFGEKSIEYCFVRNCGGIEYNALAGGIIKIFKMRRLCIDYFLIIITWTWGFFSQNLQFDFPQQLSTKEYFFSGGGSVVTTSSRDFKYFPYLRLWMDYRHQVWAVGTPLVDDIIERPYTGAGDVLATWSCSSDSSLYIQL